ncbi:cytochrome P450 4d1-like [Bradysia coprophila]|uniref:cytochrome P450 4d1-like n=1 Tax=Bradysia coprophila TaxID=38358 RepID=UPI00187DD05B|nr:cytochrome P450 4d1-like [Bradysia coprophila]
MFIYVVVCSLSLMILWYHWKYKTRNDQLAQIPSPYKYPLIHNTLEFVGKSPKQIFDWMEGMSRKLGPIYQFTFEPFDNSTMVISDPKIVEQILTSNKLIDKTIDYDLMKSWLGTGLLISSGHKWHQRRKVLTSAFHFQILEKFVEIMDEQGNTFVRNLEKFDGQEINVATMVNLYALDVICESAMGCKINAQNDTSEYANAVKEIAEIIFLRSFDPIRRFDLIYKFTEMYRREQKALQILHEFTDSVIRSRRNELFNSKTKTENTAEDMVGSKRKMALLDLLLQSTVDGEPLSDIDIREEVDTFMFAGHDTTSSAISFVLYNVAKYPDVQRKVYEEVANHLQDGDHDVSLKDLNNFRYLDLVIKESLRIYPIVPYFGRRLCDDVKVDGLTLPRYSNVYISPFIMGRDENIFPNPMKFDPERFDLETTTDKWNPFCYVPFSAGPRNCIGQKFASYEMKCIISKIVRNFELSLGDHSELPIYSELVLRSENGIILKVNKRKSV